VLSLVRRAKKNLPDDLRAPEAGAHFHLVLRDGPALFDGVENHRLSACYHGKKVRTGLDTFCFAAHACSGEIAKRGLREQASLSLKEPDEPHLVFAAILSAGRPTPATRRGLDNTIRVQHHGGRRCRSAAAAGRRRITGVPFMHPVVTGSAKVNLQ